MDRNPYAAPIATTAGGLRRIPIDAVPAEPEYGTLDVVEQAAKPPRSWRLALGRHEAWLFAPAESSAFALTHAELAQHATILPWSRFVALVVRGLLPDGRAIAFKIEGAAIDPFRRWVTSMRELHVASALRKRLRYSLPLGIFIAATALPILGPGFDPFALAFGAGIAILAAVGPRAPRRGLFAVEALLWLSLAASHVVSVVHGSTWSIPFALFAVFIGRQSLRTFSFYR